MAILIKDTSTDTSWDIPLLYVKEVSLLSNIYDDTGETKITVASPLFEHVYKFLVQRERDFLQDMSVKDLIILFKYADYLNFERMQDAIGHAIANRMEAMSPEDLLNITDMF